MRGNKNRHGGMAQPAMAVGNNGLSLANNHRMAEAAALKIKWRKYRRAKMPALARKSCEENNIVWRLWACFISALASLRRAAAAASALASWWRPRRQQLKRLPLWHEAHVGLSIMAP